MTDHLQPRKVPMWEFFNEHPDASAPLTLGRLEELGEGDRKAAELFVEALKGRQRVLDVGCGTGLPGLYVAAHVEEVMCLDAAPNMVAAARGNAARLDVQNVAFLVAGAESLPFGDEEFDGASLLGVLESMDWRGVHATMAEVRRVLRAGAGIAILDRDWSHVLANEPGRRLQVRQDDRGPTLQVLERSASPNLERDTRYLVEPKSPSGQMLSKELGDSPRVATSISPQDLRPEDILDAWYDEGAQFDAETLVNLLGSYGFCGIEAQVLPVYEQVLFLTARK